MSAHIPEKAHSKTGASSAHRWGVCPGSIKLSEGIVDEGSEYAAEGTVAHEVGEMCLRNAQDAIEYVGRIFTVGKFTFEVDEAMAEAVQTYLDFVRSILQPGDELLVEHSFDLSNVILPGMFGTCDCLIYRPSTGEMWVIDYKHGQGYAVEVKNNPQGQYYAVGAAFTGDRDVKKVTIVIVQPRAPHQDGPIRSWPTDYMGLFDFATSLRTLVEATYKDDAPLKAGSHCKFCPAAGFCPKLREEAVTAARAEFADAPADLPP